jgi:hypothetical protein
MQLGAGCRWSLDPMVVERVAVRSAAGRSATSTTILRRVFAVRPVRC